MKKKIFSLLIVSLLLVSALLTGCASSATDEGAEGSAHSNEKLTVAAYFFPVVLEPSKDWNSWQLVEFGFGETLTKYSRTGEVIPWLAESWNISETDDTVWEIKLREDVVFSNGTPMTATKVKESMERLYSMEDPDNGGMGNPHTHFTFDSIEADDENFMVYIKTTIPTPDLPGALAYPWQMIVDAEASKDMDTNTQGCITTAPYVISGFEPGISVNGVRNENYWSGVTPGFDEVEILMMEDSNMRAMALVDESINYTINLDQSAVDTVLQHENITHEAYAGTKLDYDHINLNGVLGNDALRHAVIMSIDGDLVANNVLEGIYDWGFSVIPSGLDFGYDQLTNTLPYDLDAAIKLLDDAGIVDTNNDGIRELDGENIVINYVTEPSAPAVEARAELIKKLGVNVELVFTEDVIPPMNAGEFDIIISNDNTTPTGDPAKYLAHWYSKSNNNYIGFANEEYDAIYEKLLVEFDASVRREYVIQLQQIIIDNGLVLVQGYPENTVSYTTGLVGTEMGAYYYYWVTPEMRFE